MFLDDAEQVFILVFDVWMRFRQNRSKLRSVPHPSSHLSDELQVEQPTKAAILFAV